MMQSVPSTFSPSSFRITRSTPCVDGCCGPMLRTSSVESRKVASAIPRSLPAWDSQILLHPPIVLLQNSVVLAQRESLPFIGHQDSPHVRVPGEFDPEHIVHLSLQPIGGQVYSGRGLGLVAIGDVRLDAHAFIAREAI